MNLDKITHRGTENVLVLEENHHTDTKTDSWIIWDTRALMPQIIGRIDKLYDAEYHHLVLDDDTKYKSALKQLCHIRNYYTNPQDLLNDVEKKVIENPREIIPDTIKTQMVQDAQSIESLCMVFDEICPVMGSQKEYTAEKLKQKIEQLKALIKVSNGNLNNIPWNLMTRTHGIRAKCMELFWYRKYEI